MMSPNLTAPFFATKKILIKATPEKVWSVLTNIDRWPAWQPAVKMSKLNGALQPGTTFYFTASGMKIHSRLHTVEPFMLFGWTGKAAGMFAIHNWSFTEINGQTEVRVSESMEGLLMRLFKRSFSKKLETAMVESLELLKKACE
jgi:hypothetical protein